MEDPATNILKALRGEQIIRTCSTCDTKHDLMTACPGCGGGPAPFVTRKEDYPYWGMTRKQVLKAKAAAQAKASIG